MHDLSPSELGLRERKRLATAAAIEHAAVTLVARDGYEGATVEAMCAEADVSLRTFFNYFPSKDHAIVGSSLVILDEDEALAIIRENAPDMVGAVVKVADHAAASVDLSSSLMARRRELIGQHPPLLRHHFAAIEDFENTLTTLVARHLSEHPASRRLGADVTPEHEARLTVAIGAAALRFSMHVWVESGLDAMERVRIVEQSVDQMAKILEGSR